MMTDMRASVFLAALLVISCSPTDVRRPTGSLPPNRLRFPSGAYVVTRVGSMTARPFTVRNEPGCKGGSFPYRIDVADTLFLSPEGDFKFQVWRWWWYREDFAASMKVPVPVGTTIFVSGTAKRKRNVIELVPDNGQVLRFAIQGASLAFSEAAPVGCPGHMIATQRIFTRIGG